MDLYRELDAKTLRRQVCAARGSTDVLLATLDISRLIRETVRWRG